MESFFAEVQLGDCPRYYPLSECGGLYSPVVEIFSVRDEAPFPPEDIQTCAAKDLRVYRGNQIFDFELTSDAETPHVFAYGRGAWSSGSGARGHWVWSFQEPAEENCKGL